MICKNCGADIPDTDRFCGKCGWNADKIKSNKKEDRHDTYKKEQRESRYDIMTVMSTVMGILILTAAVSIIFVLVIKQTTGNNGNANNANSNIVQNEDVDDNIGDDSETGNDSVEVVETNVETHNSEQSIGTLTIVSDVNIRDNPDTDNSNVIKVAKADETYEYLGLADYGNWYIILLEDGTKGYVYKGYVSTTP